MRERSHHQAAPRVPPAVVVEQALRSWGWDVRAYDPHVLESAFGSVLEAAAEADALVLMTDHREFQTLDPKALRDVMRGSLVLDARGLLDETAWRTAGFELQRLGAPSSSTPFE